MTTSDIMTTDYYHGVMSKEQAELTLQERDGRLEDGRFLVRRSMKPPHNCAIAIAYQNVVYHYNIERRPHGRYCINGGKLHSSVYDLVQHHRKKKDKMVTLAKVPCHRPDGKGHYIWAGVTHDVLLKKLDKLFQAYTRNVQPESLRRKMQGDIEQKFKREFHRYQSWYASMMEREEAELVLTRNRPEINGKYLLRTNTSGEHCISLLCGRAVHHYKILVCVDCGSNETVTIAGIEHKFSCIMDLLTVLHDIKALECKLTEPCNVKGERMALMTESATAYRSQESSRSNKSLQKNVVYHRWPDNSDNNDDDDDDGDDDDDDSDSDGYIDDVDDDEDDDDDDNRNYNKRAQQTTMNNIKQQQQQQQRVKQPYQKQPKVQQKKQKDLRYVPEYSQPFKKQQRQQQQPPLLKQQTERSRKQQHRQQQQQGNTTRKTDMNGSNTVNPYSKMVTKVDIECLLREEDWYKSGMTREQAERYLKDKDRKFLVRKRPLNGEFILSYLDQSTSGTAGQATGAQAQGAVTVIHAVIYITLRERSATLVFSAPNVEKRFTSIEQFIQETCKCDENEEKDYLEAIRGDSGTTSTETSVRPKKCRDYEQVKTNASYCEDDDDDDDEDDDVDDNYHGGQLADTERVHKYIVKELKRYSRTLHIQQMEEDLKSDRLYEESLFNISESELTGRKEIGSGLFSKIYQSTLQQGEQTRQVALKIKNVTGKQEDTETTKRSLQEEGLLLKNLDSDFIIGMFGFSALRDGQVALVLELAEHGNLGSYITKNRSIPQDGLLGYMQDVLEGMSYLETERIIHRDLVTSNILLTSHNTRQVAKISDFGLSLQLQDTSDHFSWSGDMRLLMNLYPPEVFVSKRFDLKTDVWSFGLLMWEVISRGEQPYKGYTIDQYKAAISNGSKPTQPANCHESVYIIMTQCWLPNEDRPTFRELKELLSEAREGVNKESDRTVRNKLLSDESDEEVPQPMAVERYHGLSSRQPPRPCTRPANSYQTLQEKPN